jgi:hypothetical protein
MSIHLESLSWERLLTLIAENARCCLLKNTSGELFWSVTTTGQIKLFFVAIKSYSTLTDVNDPQYFLGQIQFVLIF